MVRARPARALACGLLAGLLSWGLVGQAGAETPSPAPEPSATPAVSPAPAETPAAQGRPSAPSSPSVPSSPSTPASRAAAADDPSAFLTLAVAPRGGPVADAFYEDLGSFAFSGSVALADGSQVRVERRDASGWTAVATTAVTAGAYAVSLPVEAAGTATFRARGAGTEGADVVSAEVGVEVEDSRITVSAASKVDSLKSLTVRGAIVPARGGVTVHLDVHDGTRWSNSVSTTTAADGSYLTSVSTGKGRLKKYGLRASYRATNRPRWERSPGMPFTRIAVLDAEVDDTTSADVAKTYRKGCPVGASKLSTIHLNYLGYDGRMHRGVIIIRTDLRQEIIRGFGKALDKRFPIAKMNNPNTYGGNDPKQMAANNTSGFNCRKVVGNPYKMSPHSYGTALDVNTVQNPYRDARGKWWPSAGKKYRDRSPLKKGMLGSGSALTTSLAGDKFFWGGRWNPGRDYQHFEYRG
ncbi:D-alanyl-D-alanine carboxypeptidase [Microlunatus sagamiharensis]|uniref:D-alanyl-D-alanine carboxypeptidase n=1 Tax=Microlunatus sagamiharensis TaxID=546874 RepID=A0A1H2MTF6_9ACTN|nr:M15 family metallopeptidase [Microlunatus sagamiharensis]SDU96352.1 D-alanyl-D-alanine carboxypeptidase [Microlunatus sagamiharensis]